MPFQGWVLGYFWWFQFKCKNLEFSIILAKWLEVCGTQGFTNNACTSFHINLTTLYTQHNYLANYITYGIVMRQGFKQGDNQGKKFQ